MMNGSIFYQKDPDQVIPKFGTYQFRYMILISQILFIGIYVSLFFANETEGWVSTIAGLLFLLSFLLLIVGNILFRLTAINRWKNLAIEFGLDINQSNFYVFPIISGTFRNYPIKITFEPQKIIRNGFQYTTVEIAFPEPIQNSFEINPIDNFNHERILTSYKEIDERIKVSSSSELFTKRLLSSRRVRQGLIELGQHTRYRNLTITNEMVQYYERMLIYDTYYLSSVIRFLTELADLAKKADTYT